MLWKVLIFVAVADGSATVRMSAMNCSASPGSRSSTVSTIDGPDSPSPNSCAPTPARVVGLAAAHDARLLVASTSRPSFHPLGKSSGARSVRLRASLGASVAVGSAPEPPAQPMQRRSASATHNGEKLHLRRGRRVWLKLSLAAALQVRQMVAPAGFEPAISALKGRRPGPLDDGATRAEVYQRASRDRCGRGLRRIPESRRALCGEWRIGSGWNRSKRGSMSRAIPSI